MAEFNEQKKGRNQEEGGIMTFKGALFQLVFNTNIYSKAILPRCSHTDVLDLRLVSSQFQKNTLNYMLKTYYINLKEFSLDHNNFINLSSLQNICEVLPKDYVLVKQMSTLKKMQLDSF